MQLPNDSPIHKAFVQAMHDRKVCVLTDKRGQKRIAEPYGIFITRQKQAMYCCYQLAGYSGSGRLPAWRNFAVDRIDHVEVTTRSFRKRNDFNPDNKDNYYLWADRI